MYKRLLLVVSVFVLLTSALVLFSPTPQAAAQTIPTRTPTPSGGGGGSSPTNTPQPFIAHTGVPETSTPAPVTNTPQPANTNTPVPASTAVPSWTPSPVNTQAPANTAVPTWTPVPANTQAPTNTPVPSWTPSPVSVNTAVPTWTPVPANTQAPANTPVPSWTPSPVSVNTAVPTWTPLPPNTAVPTWTPRPPNTPVPTWTPLASGGAQPTWTPAPFSTAVPTWTLEPTRTPVPTWTPVSNNSNSGGNNAVIPTWTPVSSNNGSNNNAVIPTWTPVTNNSGSGSQAGSQGSTAPVPTWTPLPNGDPQPTWTPQAGGAGQASASGGASCNLLPSALPLANGTALKGGPDDAYDSLRLLNQTDRLQLLGRYGFGAWWYVELDNGTGQRGWVSNNSIRISGYATLLPELGAPALNGVQPTPAPRWQITPVPGSECRCGLRPVVQTYIELANIHTGPGAEFPVVDSLRYLGIRPIRARYGFGEWWQIELDNGQTGWIAQDGVNVYGHSALVPVLTAEQISAELLPGLQWQPTPHPGCPNPPPAAAQTTTGASASSGANVTSTIGEATAAVNTSDTLAPIPTQTSAASSQTTSDDESATAAATSQNSDENTDDSSSESGTAVPDGSTDDIAATGSDSVELEQGEDSTQGNGAIDIDLGQRSATESAWIRGLLSLGGGLVFAAIAWYGWFLLGRRRRKDSVTDEEI